MRRTAATVGVRAVPGGIADKIVRLRVYDVPRHVGRELDHPAIRGYKAEALHFHLDQAVAAMTASGHDGSIVTATDGGYPRGFEFGVRGMSGNAINGFNVRESGPSDADF